MKVKICERVLWVITFTCKQFLNFQRFTLKFNKKVQSRRVSSFGILSLGSCIHGSRVLGSRVLGCRGPGSQILDPRFRLCLLFPHKTVYFSNNSHNAYKNVDGNSV